MSARDSSRPRDTRALLGSGLIALTAVAGAGPATAQSPSVAPPAAAPSSAQASSVLTADVESLRARSATFWAARIVGDSKAQWDLLEPRGRGRISAAEYVPGGGPLKYLAYQVEDAKVNGYFATVKVRLLVQPVLVSPGGHRLGPEVVVTEDAWVRIRGTWYRSLEQDRSQGSVGAPH